METDLLPLTYRRLPAPVLVPVTLTRCRKSAQEDILTRHFLLLALLVTFSGPLFAQQLIEHPFLEQKDIKSETCLTCHPEKKQGKFVHSAVGTGCENCHQATSEKGKTTITLVAEGGALCAMCHEASKDEVQHGPYRSGQCLVCHDPHSSEFKAQTRAEVNQLCLACHGLAPPRGDMASAIASQKISKADLDAMPKIELDPTLRLGHPWATHPVAEIADPLHAGEKMSCLSCHTHHSSTQDNLILAVKGPGNICTSCHKVIDEAAAAKSKGQSQPPAQQQAQQKPDITTPSGEKEKP